MARATEMPAAPPRPADDGARLPRRSAPERRAQRRHPARRPRRDGRRRRARASTRSGSRIRPSSARSRGSRCPTGRAASTSTSPRSGCTSTATRSRPASASPPEQVRIHLAGVGGAFGGREDLSMQVHGALLALHTGRAVRIVYGRAESFVGHVHRHPGPHALRAPRDARRAPHRACTARSCWTAAPTPRARRRSSRTPARSRSGPTPSRTR